MSGLCTTFSVLYNAINYTFRHLTLPPPGVQDTMIATYVSYRLTHMSNTCEYAYNI